MACDIHPGLCDIDLSDLYALAPLASCSALVAKAYRTAGLNLIDKVLNLVTPDDLDPRPGDRPPSR